MDANHLDDDDGENFEERVQRDRQEKLETIQQLPPYTGKRVNDDDPYLGFAYDKSGQKCKITYCSAPERAWCECSELVTQKLFEEAEDLFLNEVQIYLRFDHALYAKIRMGLLLANKHKTGTMGENDFKEAYKAITKAVWSDSGLNWNELFDKLDALVSHRLHDLGVPNRCSYDSDDDSGNKEEEEENNGDGEDCVLDINESISLDYDKVTDPKVLQIAIKLWYGYAQVMESCDCGVEDYGDGYLDALHCVYDALLAVDQSKTSLKLVQTTTAKLINYGAGNHYTAIYLAIHAETPEALGDKAAAHKSYCTLKRKKCTEPIVQTEVVPGGTLEARIQRTK